MLWNNKNVGEKAMRKMKIGKAIRIDELSLETVQRNGKDYETHCMNALITQKKNIIKMFPYTICI